ncbi:MAG: phosphate transport system permease protein [Candidatus Binatota bacterium]|nr:phosphate transport system permease protein [Candidatus Binatota bacterium]
MKSLWKSGDPFVWLSGGALALSLLMVAGLIGLVLRNGFGYFWPGDLVELGLRSGRVVLGEIVERQAIPDPGAAVGERVRYRVQVKQGNRDAYGADFLWIDEDDVVRQRQPADAVVIERREWGNAYGFVTAVKEGDETVARGADAWRALHSRLPETTRLTQEIRDVETGTIGAISYEQERIRVQLRGLQRRNVLDPEKVRVLEDRARELQAAYDQELARLALLRARLTGAAILAVAGAGERVVPLEQIVRAERPNEMDIGEKLAVYLSKVWEFVSANPRESNTEGGVFPAIFGTVMMVVVMSILVVPLGVLAAFYLREYARQGAFVSAVRIAVNNLAGVPSIVFGVFGVGFFIYTIGGSIDRFFYADALPTPTFGTGGILWASLTLALLTVPVVIVATEEGLAAVPRGAREASLALGATKFETMWRVVLPAVLPSILTGLILAMARAAGEVAPLMLTGVVKLAPALPLDGFAPFLHLDRKFMHLGFHIYDVGFQSPNVDAARPMVYNTTLLLLLIVLALNLTAIVLRNRLKRRLTVSAV